MIVILNPHRATCGFSAIGVAEFLVGAVVRILSNKKANGMQKLGAI